MENALKAIGQSKKKPHILVWNPVIATTSNISNGITTITFCRSRTMDYAALYLGEWSNQSDEDIVVSIEGKVEMLFFECMRNTTMQGVIALDPYILFQKDIPLDQALQEVSVILRPEFVSMFFEWLKKTPIYRIDPKEDIAFADLIAGLDNWMNNNFGLTPPDELIELIQSATSQDEDGKTQNKETMPDGQPIH